MNWTLKCARPPGGSDPFVSMTSCGRQQGGISCNKIVCADISFVLSSPKYTRSRSLAKVRPHVMFLRPDPAMALDFGVAKRGPVMCTRSLQSCSGVAPRKLAPKRQAQFYVSLPQAHAHSPFSRRIARPPTFRSLRVLSHAQLTHAYFLPLRCLRCHLGL